MITNKTSRNISMWLPVLFFLGLGFYATAQTPDGEHIRCITVETENSRLDDRYQEYLERFESYIARQKADLNRQTGTVYTIPVVFHVIHDNDNVGSGDNISATYINAQIDQLNNDFRKVMGTTGDGAGEDTEIQFCAAVLDENDNVLAESGIDRIDRNTKGWTAPPYGEPVLGCLLGANLDYINNTIKPQSIWNPEEYMNIWVLDMVCGILGYAQFPEASTLPGIGTGNGGADSDGVVVLPTTVGSTDEPFPGGGVYNKGRTLTHEVGHWLGLRHIWGDGDCSADDFCADTPNTGDPNYGCPNEDSCPGDGPDQVENYMDYTDDDCMNIFTQDQTDRMRIVMGATGVGSPRREILASSTKCGSVMDGFSITATNSPVSVTQPDDAVFTFDVAFTGSFTGPVTLSTSGLPASITSSFSTNPVNSAGSYSVTLSGTGNVAAATYNFSIDGTDGGSTTASEPAILIVAEPNNSDCFTEVSTNVPVNILNSTTVSSEIIVGTSGILTDVNVYFNGDHGRARDLIFELRSPSGTRIQLFDAEDACPTGGADDFDIGFDDQSILTIVSDVPCPPTDGRYYQPEEALSIFDGEEVNGIWTLLITDDRNQQTGQLNYWEIEFCTEGTGGGCDTDLTLNQDPIESGTYKASDFIRSAGKVEVDPMGSVVFEAGNFIELKDGFTALAGSSFTARIQECSATITENTIEARTETIETVSSNKLSVFPNPFNEQTTIAIDLAQESAIAVQLYDLTGRQVATIAASNTQTAGTHQYTVNAADLEAGIYILMVRIGEEIQTKKLSIVR